MPSLSIPEQGQLVDVRQRRYVVSEVKQSTLPLDALHPTTSAPYHLVTLNSVEDDALGEELQVLWEIEPGARVAEKMVTPEPTGFDDPRLLDAFLNAVQWGAASSTELRTLQSPFRSGITIEDYQLDPVVRAIQMPRVNLLVADDVGLGKTIESGLVAQELILRHRVRKVLIVCPAALQIQWRDQMRDKFGLEFRIVDSELMRDLRRKRGLHVNPWTHFPRLITSIDFLKREQPLRLFREALPAPGEPIYPRRFDLMIVDEAHNIAPSGRGKYATDSRRTAAIRLLVPHFEHKLFLAATPHNGYAESFTALLEMLDNQRFARGVTPNQQQLGAVMVRRLKSEIMDWDGKPLFPQRKLEALEIDYTDDERNAHRLLQRYTGLRRHNLSDEAETFATEFVLKILKKRLFSSPESFASTLVQHEHSLNEARRQTAAPRPRLGILRSIVEQADEEFGDDNAYAQATNDALDEAVRLFHPPSAEEQSLLRQMRDWADKARKRADSKAEQLIAWLKQEIKPAGQWSARRVIIFTEYRDTQRWLLDILRGAGLAEGERLMQLFGGMQSDDREKVKAAFQADPAVSPVRILLATDAASEGIDLQNHCSRLIHYEIPWNPNRMEQRNGRVDRHGQRAKEVLVYHFVGKGYRARRDWDAAPGELEADLEFLMRAAIKVNTIREDLGKVGPVIAEQVEAAMLGRSRILIDDDAARRESEPVRRMLRFERNLQKQIEEMHEQLQETRRQLNLTPANVQHVVETALELSGQPRLIPARVSGVSPAFNLPPLRGSWASCSEGLQHPHTGVIRPIVFDHDLAKDRDDVVLVHLGHRLVQMSLRLLRAEVWSPVGQRKLNRVTARLVPSNQLETPAVVIHARLMILGSDNQRLHEELIHAGGFLREGRFARMNVGEVERVLASKLDTPAPADLQRRLAELWPSYHAQLLQSLEVRKQERSASLERQMAERADKEAADITTIMQELRRAIEKELHQPELVQLELFSSAEKEQFEQNVRSLQSRLTQIPAEIARETAAIRSRFADPQARVFPVAITYLVPERLAH